MYKTALVLSIVFFYSCKKATDPKRYVTYQVYIKSGNSVNILCGNDYFFDSGGNLKTITYKADMDYFSSTHLAAKNENYFIQITPNQLIEDTVNIAATVSINDSVVNYKTSKTFKESILLTGTVY